ncbi:MAG: hypothetical protein ACI4R6_01415 [Lachnospiraceae bacterium]
MGNVTREEFEKNLTKAINEKKKREKRKKQKMDDEFHGYMADLIRDSVNCKRQLAMKNRFSEC